MILTHINTSDHDILVRDVYWKNIYLWNEKENNCDWFIWFIMSIKDLIWKNWILETIEWIKNVEISKAEYEKRLKREKDMWIEAMRKENIDYEPMSFLIDAPENFTKKQLSQTYYSWSGWELWWAESYSDITVCFSNFSDEKEYYKTSEVLEVLEKWKEALEKWNDPDERMKMIEDYESKSHERV